MKIEAKSVSCIEIYIGDQSIGIFEVKSEWNGLSELRRIKDGNMLVIGTPDVNGFNMISGDIFGNKEKKETYLINGSLDLIEKIKELAEVKDGNLIK